MILNQYLQIQLELIKDVKVGEQVRQNQKFQLHVPEGVPWQDAEDACDEFKATLQNMKARQLEAIESLKPAQEAPQEVTPEIVG